MTKVLVTGVESSGTRMVADLLTRAGAEVTHSSPHYRIGEGKQLWSGLTFDAVVVVVRNSYPHLKSLLENGHADNEREAQWMAMNGLRQILNQLFHGTNTFLVTYESLVHEPESLTNLCRQLGLPESFSHDPVQDANVKYYGGAYFRDDRTLQERVS